MIKSVGAFDGLSPEIKDAISKIRKGGSNEDKQKLVKILGSMQEKALADRKSDPTDPNVWKEGDPLDKGIPSMDPTNYGPGWEKGEPLDKGIPKGLVAGPTEKQISNMKAIDLVGPDGKVYNTFKDVKGNSYFGDGKIIPPSIMAGWKPVTSGVQKKVAKSKTSGKTKSDLGKMNQWSNPDLGKSQPRKDPSKMLPDKSQRQLKRKLYGAANSSQDPVRGKNPLMEPAEDFVNERGQPEKKLGTSGIIKNVKIKDVSDALDNYLSQQGEGSKLDALTFLNQ